ncbi:hypothetical protein ASE03_20665, partial [Kitasatospora sp. Root187]|uniref:alpha-glucosidase C-terminal domain-containing protein n=1 Tax=Kitasatospora sp. Root187 TaxID=1736486 RepID=UPI00070A983E
PALQQLRDLTFHPTDNDHILAYSKQSGTDTVITVVNLDPQHVQEATVSLDLAALGLTEGQQVSVRDELTGAVYQWGRDNYVRLDPAVAPAHLLTVDRGAPV